MAVGVGLDDRPELGTREQLEQPPRVPAQRAEVDRDLAASHLFRARASQTSGARSQPSPASARWMPGSRSLATRPRWGETSPEASPWATAAAAAARARLQALGEEGGQHPGEDVAAAGRRERGPAVGGDEHALARGGDERVGPFQQHDRPEARRRASHGSESVGIDLGGVGAEEPRELAAVGGEHRRRRRARTAPGRRGRPRRARPAR